LKWGRVWAAVVPVILLFSSPAFASTSYPNDYFFAAGRQWALSGSAASINAPAAWCVSTGAGVTIGHVDTGADFSHPDLHGKLIAGAAFVKGDGSMTGQGPGAVQDDNGHGTSTAGILVATTDNREGVAGVAPDARALVVKVLDQGGAGYSSDIAAGVRWAVDHGAQVINISIGFDRPLIGQAPDNIPRAVAYAAEHQVAVAVASGGTPLPFTTEQVDQIASQALVVGPLTPDGEVAPYAGDPTGVNIYAPGGGSQQDDGSQHFVVSTHWSEKSPGGYIFAEGASVASPHVAGVLALLMAKGYTAPQAREQILTTATRLKGIPQLDAARALGAGGLCGARVAAPIAAAGRPQLDPRPPVKTAAPDASGAPAPASPTVIVIAEPAENPNPAGHQGRTATLVLGRWFWLALIVAVTAWLIHRRASAARR
jgi:serine protease